MQKKEGYSLDKSETYKKSHDMSGDFSSSRKPCTEKSVVNVEEDEGHFSKVQGGIVPY